MLQFLWYKLQHFMASSLRRTLLLIVLLPEADFILNAQVREATNDESNIAVKYIKN